MSQPAMNKLNVEIFSDLVCPWCWVGKRKLEKALATYDKPIEAEVIWRPYQLRPGAPAEGVLKAPDTPDNPRVGARMKAAGASVGIDFTGKCDRSPNTLLAHTLLDYVFETYGPTKQNEVQEVLFRSYFTDGIFPNLENLIVVGEECGLDKSKVETALTDQDIVRKVSATLKRNNSVVRGGVPFFVFNGRPAFSGAQDPSTFHDVFDMLLEEN